MLWAYIYCYQLTLDNHQQNSTDEHSSEKEDADSIHPVCVYCRNTNRIIQLNYAAQKIGIEVGHGLAQAAALCPYIHIIPFNKENETQLLTQLAHRLYPLASDIVLDTHNGLAIRLDNLVQYYGGHSALWKTLARELSLAKVRYHFANAWTIEAAKVLAFAQTNANSHSHEQVKQTLAKCSLSLTALSDKVVASLTRVGITRIQELLDMPVHELGKRFDNNTITYLTTLRGEIFPKATLFRPSAHFNNVMALPFDIENTQHLVPFITQQLEQLAHYLRARNLYTSTIHVAFHFREALALQFSVCSALPQASVKSWLSLLTLKIETIVLPEPVISVTLKCTEFDDMDSESRDFFHNRFNEIAQKQLIGRLNAKLGDNSTYQPQAADSHQFEFMTVAERNTAHYSYASDITPTFTFDTPKPLTQQTQVCFGPVRLSNEWWRGSAHKRDYFIAQTPHGVRMLIFKDESSQWWAQGIYC